MSVEPLYNSRILNENFLRFHLQDKHNASIFNGLGAPKSNRKSSNYFIYIAEMKRFFYFCSEKWYYVH